jgi:imidazolonepropionase-like amidohydrolase
MRVAVEAGMTPAQAIDATTIIPARALNLSDRIGSIAAGKGADLVLVRGTPFSDITDMEDVVAVYMAGQRVGDLSGNPADALSGWPATN